MNKKPLLIAPMLALAILTGPLPTSASSLTGWVDYSITKSETGSGVEISISVDTSAYSSDTLVTMGPPSSGEMVVNSDFKLCASYPPSNMNMDCTSYQATKTVSTTSAQVMNIVYTFTTSQWDAALNLGQSMNKPVAVSTVNLALPSTRNLPGGGSGTSLTITKDLSQASPGNSSGAQSQQAVKYAGPELQISSGIKSQGGNLTIEGKKLTQVTGIKLQDKTVEFSIKSETEIELSIPSGLAPGKYDLEITSSHGRLIQIGAITVKSPTQVASFSLKGAGSKVDAFMLSELSNIGLMFNSDYKKITCVANAADAETAAAIADKVCRTLKADELRHATTKSVAKTTYKGEGFWVRVYIAG